MRHAVGAGMAAVAIVAQPQHAERPALASPAGYSCGGRFRALRN
jgi:hypothetical protein